MRRFVSNLLRTFLPFTLLIFAACSQNSPQSTPTPEVEDNFQPVVNATGKVVPDQYANLSMQTSGAIEELLVSEGQIVRKDQPLIRLGGRDQSEAAVSAAETELLSAEQSLQDLYDNLDQTRALAGQRLADAKKALEDAEKRRSYKDYGRASQATLDEARANYILAQNKFEEIEDEYNEVAWMAEDSDIRAAVLSQYGAARSVRDRALENLNWLLGKPNEVEVAQADAVVAVAKSEADASQRELDKLKNGPNPDQLALAKARLKNAQDSLSAVKTSLGNLEMKAPFAGSVSRLYMRNNEWTLPGQPVLLIANLDRLQIETTDLSEIDVARVTLGNEVKITFDALPDVEASGKVTRISPKSTEGSGVNYTVIISFDETPSNLLWGMTAFVDIIVSP
jgi:multidrug efflux pump subunit AcrA (membrane-fusion protein)